MFRKLLFLVLIGPVAWSSPIRAQEKGVTPKAKQACEKFIKAVVTRDVDGAMKVVDVPWFDNIEGNPRLVLDSIKLRDALKTLSDNFKGTAQKVRLEVLEEFSYESVQGAWAERGQLDLVLTKSDRILSVRAEVDDEKGNRIFLLVSLRGGQYKVVGTKNP